MKCPHCLTSFHDNLQKIEIGADRYSAFHIYLRSCPECNRFIISLNEDFDKISVGGGGVSYRKNRQSLCYPRAINRSPIPTEIPEKFANDYREACLTLSDSPKASAALSRRCLQHLLREKAGVKKGDLANEIQQIMDEKSLPPYLLDSLDAVRNIGNFAAHPIKSKTTGEILDVEAGEAVWNLDVIESLFDYFFVQPVTLQKKREALNAKLQEAGKPPMK
jgi:hypothetical protein